MHRLFTYTVQKATVPRFCLGKYQPVLCISRRVSIKDANDSNQLSCSWVIPKGPNSKEEEEVISKSIPIGAEMSLSLSALTDGGGREDEGESMVGRGSCRGYKRTVLANDISRPLVRAVHQLQTMSWKWQGTMGRSNISIFLLVGIYVHMHIYLKK